MKFNINDQEVTYATFVGGLIKHHEPAQVDFLHGPIGVAKEGGELLDAAYRHWNYNKPLDRENIIEEAGDILFYLQATLASVGSTLEEAIVGNVQKLWKRYPDGYSDTAALARADKEPGT